MVERSKRGKQKRKLLASHARSWLWGRNLVRETLLAARWPIVELHLADDLPQDLLDEARQAAARLDLKVQISPREFLQQLAGTAEHQGYVARMGPYPYAGPAEVFAAAGGTPLFLVLDAIQDPFNFGAMLRSAEAFGVNGVFIAERDQAPVSSMVARSSAGGVNRVPIVQMPSLVELVETLRQKSVQVIGASEKGSQAITLCNFRGGTAIVIGNEGTGIRAELAVRCTMLAAIPLQGALGSLNAAAAAAVFLYEAQRQRTG